MPAASPIRFKATLLRPQGAGGGSWLFLMLPRSASARLPSRGMAAVAGTFNSKAFRTTLEPDGRKGHWLKVDPKLRKAVGVDAGDVVTLVIEPITEEPEPKLPADLRRALAAAPKAHAVWTDITPRARRDWIQWIVSAKLPATRARRILNASQILATGKRRVCCFDRSGFYSKGLSAPKPASGG
jgi:hypothetical protein